MNPQPPESTCVLITIIFILGVAVSAFKAHTSTTSMKINDMYDIGHIRESNNFAPLISYTVTYKQPQQPQQRQHVQAPVIVPKTKPVTAQIPKPKTKPETQPKQVERLVYTPLQQDCYDALIGLKMTKKEAKFVVNNTFNKHDINTIQEFLALAFIRS
jgi:outer membrane biosynthesis protein TonB